MEKHSRQLIKQQSNQKHMNRDARGLWNDAANPDQLRPRREAIWRLLELVLLFIFLFVELKTKIPTFKFINKAE